MSEQTVLVLGGGPDAEREVSIDSANAVADALRESGAFGVELRIIDRVNAAELREISGDVVFPVLHGPWGEGGQLQDELALDGRPFVGALADGARLAMDKVGTKLTAATLGIRVNETRVINPHDAGAPMAAPCVIKPVHDGSSVGLHLCRDAHELARAMDAVREDAAHGRAYLAEPLVEGRELTVGVVDWRATSVVEIRPASGVYDYEAKYHRDDTAYDVRPHLPEGVGEEVAGGAERLARAIGARHLARVDFMLDRNGRAWLIELNTIPGFTSHSLLPMASAADGVPMPVLCERLVRMAVRDAGDVR